MGLLKSKLRERIATRADVDAIRGDLTKLRRRVEGLPDLAELARRLREVTKQLTSQETKLTKQDAKLTGQEAKLTGQGGTLNKLVTDVRALGTRTSVLTIDYERMAHQLAATETRIESLRCQIESDALAGTPAEHSEARSLIEEIRREHDQIRIRFQVISNYEERLSRVEDLLARVPEFGS